MYIVDKLEERTRKVDYPISLLIFFFGILWEGIMYQRHGESSPRTKEYNAWRGLIQRCNPKTRLRDREHYYDRGISVCHEWKDSYPAFLEYIGRAPTPLHEVDRIDNDGNYEPGNVKWSTRKENGNNKTNNHFYYLDGKRFNNQEFADYTGCNLATVWLWVIKKGKTEEWLRQHMIKYRRLTKKVKVCNKCLRASCLKGDFYCDDYLNAGVAEKTVRFLEKRKLEDSSYWG